MSELGNILLYLLLLVAIACGYFLGRRERKRARPQKAVIKDYYQGLNFLLGDRPELGIERFIETMEVSDQTIDVHLAMASVVRRRGEVDKAIRIHQNMLAMPVLNGVNKQLVELELARDYQLAGLLDRAENLLVQIADKRGSQSSAAVELLLDLYEQEREWRKAIDISGQLGRSTIKIKSRVSHFHCELAEIALRESEHKVAQTHIRQAIEADPSQPRAHWLSAQLAMQLKHYKKVIKHIRRAVELKPSLVGEYLETYRLACENMNSEEEFERFLKNSAELHPDPKVLRALIGVQRQYGQPVAENFTREIERAPVLEHVPLLLEIADFNDDSELDASVREQINKIVRQESTLQCGNCGFNSHQLMWHCPTCKSWGTFG